MNPVEDAPKKKAPAKKKATPKKAADEVVAVDKSVEDVPKKKAPTKKKADAPKKRLLKRSQRTAHKALTKTLILILEGT